MDEKGMDVVKCHMLDKNFKVTIKQPRVFDAKEQQKDILTELQENGYVVVSNVVNTDAQYALLHDLQKLSAKFSSQECFPDVYHSPGIAKIRQSRQLYDLFSQLYDKAKLWVTFESVNVWTAAANIEQRFHPRIDMHPLHALANKPMFRGMLAMTTMNERVGTYAFKPRSHLYGPAWYSDVPLVAETHTVLCGPKIEPNSEVPFEALILERGNFVIWNKFTSYSPVALARAITVPNVLSNVVSLPVSFIRAPKTLCPLRVVSYEQNLGYQMVSSGLYAPTGSRMHHLNTFYKLDTLGIKLYGLESWYSTQIKEIHEPLETPPCLNCDATEKSAMTITDCILLLYLMLFIIFAFYHCFGKCH